MSQPTDLTKPHMCDCGVFAEGYCANLKSFWSHKTLEVATVNGKRTYSAAFDAPADGRYVAFMIDISYGIPSDTEHGKGFVPRDLAGRMEFTTEVSVWPNTFPYAGCGVDNPSHPCDNALI